MTFWGMAERIGPMRPLPCDIGKPRRMKGTQSGCMILLLVIVAAIWSCVLVAETRGENLPPRIAQWQPNICRVTVLYTQFSNGFGKQLRGYGSGVYLGGGLVLTAYHCIEDAKKKGGTYGLCFYTDGCHNAVLSGWDQQADQAFLQISHPSPKDRKGVLLASKDPYVGDVIWKAGFGGDGVLYWHKGTVVKVEADEFYSEPYVRNGDSGGPVFNDSGELLGNTVRGTNPGDPRNYSVTLTPSRTARSLGSARADLVAAHKQYYGDACYRLPGPFRLPWAKPKPPQQPAPGWMPAADTPNPITASPANPGSTAPIQPSPTQPANPINPLAEAPSEPVPNDPIEEKERPSILKTMALGAAGAALGTMGIGLPAWAIWAIRGVRTARRLRSRRKSGDDDPATAPPPPIPDTRTIRDFPSRPVLEGSTTADNPRPEPAERIVEKIYTSDVPPTIERYRTHTEYVNVESDNYRRSTEWAIPHVVRKYPGAQEIMEVFQSLAEQHYSGTVPKQL